MARMGSSGASPSSSLEMRSWWSRRPAAYRGLCIGPRDYPSVAAVAAIAAQDDVVPADRVAGARLDPLERAFQPLVGERLDLPAGVADHVMVMLAVRLRRLVASGARADVDAVREPLVDEEVERSVDARDP